MLSKLIYTSTTDFLNVQCDGNAWVDESWDFGRKRNGFEFWESLLGGGGGEDASVILLGWISPDMWNGDVWEVGERVEWVWGHS